MTKSSGQIIAEVVMAIGFMALVLVSVSTLMSRSTATIRLDKQKDEANRAIGARLAYFKQERDRDATYFFDTIVHDLDGGSFSSCSVGLWEITTQYSFSCSERFTTVTSGVLAEVKASWTNKSTNDMSLVLSTIISEH